MNKKNTFWIFKVLVLTLFLALTFSVVSELVVSRSSVIVAYAIIIVIIAISILFDVIGTAAASCDVNAFLAMASKKIRGARLAVYFAKNSSRVTSICCDVIGDICGIVSGAAGSSIIIKQFAANADGDLIMFSIILSSVIAAVTVTAKAVGKSYAIKNSEKVILKVTSFLSAFGKGK